MTEAGGPMAWHYTLSCGAAVLNTEKWAAGVLMNCHEHGTPDRTGGWGTSGHLSAVVSRSRRRVPVPPAKGA